MAAWPWLYDESFEGSDQGNFDAISPDPYTSARFAHYSYLASRSDIKAAPYRGAYCWMKDLSVDTTDHYVQETGAFDVAADGTIFTRFYLYLSPVLTMANSDEFAVMQHWAGASTVEAGVYVNYTTANGYRLGIGETSASSFLPISLGEWHCVELKANVDAGGGNDGTLDGWLDGGAFTQVTGLDQGVFTSAVFGVIGQDAGTSRGVVLIDEIAAASQRLFPIVDRFPEQRIVTEDAHVFVGEGEILDLTLMAGAATNNIAYVYDTDTGRDGAGGDNDDTNFVARVTNLTNAETVPSPFHNEPIRVKRGAYIVLEGTNPRAVVHIGRAQGYWSDGRIRDHGARRRSNKWGA